MDAVQIGHVTIGTLCDILEDPNNKSHWALVRGAVFFLGMACWGMSFLPMGNAYSALCDTTIRPRWSSYSALM
jgi:hypothetical protein